ncbi:MAG: hypothetical protein K8U03_09245 [Planctomycetia bacterium]|nr:hypothetical protein [Planctomycetia bacterium]
MSLISFGRKARLYISDVGFADAGLVPVRRCKDIRLGDEADTLQAQTRDWGGTVHGAGAKEIFIECEKLLEALDTGDDVQLLRNAFDLGSELYVVVTRNAKELACGKGMRFRAYVFGWPEELPETEAAKVSLILRQSDADESVERIATPYVDDIWLELFDGSPLGLSDGSVLLLS